MDEFNLGLKTTVLTDALDGLLHDWAERCALPADRSEAIRLRALSRAGATPGQTYAWWKRLFAQPSHCALVSPCKKTNPVRRYLAEVGNTETVLLQELTPQHPAFWKALRWPEVENVRQKKTSVHTDAPGA